MRFSARTNPHHPRGYHGRVSRIPFASSADLAEKEATLEQLADGVYAYTAQGDPNVGCIIGADAVLAIEARATPVMAKRWIDVVRTLTDLPFGDLVLTHYHAVRVLGASAFGARRVITTRATSDLIEERGQEDWASERGRMPRLFEGGETIPGLTRPNQVFEDLHDRRPRQPDRGAAFPGPRAHQRRPGGLAAGGANLLCRRSRRGAGGTLHG